MKKVARKDLVVGNLYCDIDNKVSGLKVYFVGIHELSPYGSCNFFYPIIDGGGLCGYEAEEDGTIPFSLEGGCFYEQD